MPAPAPPDITQAFHQFESALTRQAWDDLQTAAEAQPNAADAKVVLAVQRYIQAGLRRDQTDPAAPKTGQQAAYAAASAAEVREMHALHALSGEIAWRLLTAMAKSEFDRGVSWYACQIGSGLSASRYEQLKKELVGRADLNDTFANAPNRWKGPNDLSVSGGPPWP